MPDIISHTVQVTVRAIKTRSRISVLVRHTFSYIRTNDILAVENVCVQYRAAQEIAVLGCPDTGSKLYGHCILDSETGVF